MAKAHVVEFVGSNVVSVKNFELVEFWGYGCHGKCIIAYACPACGKLFMSLVHLLMGTHILLFVIKILYI